MRMGDIVRFKSAVHKKVSTFKIRRLGVVGYAPYSEDVGCVTWERRSTHDIVRGSKLEVVLTKKEARAVTKLVGGTQ